MLKQQHYTLTNVKKVKSQSTTPLKLCAKKTDADHKAHKVCDRQGRRYDNCSELLHH